MYRSVLSWVCVLNSEIFLCLSMVLKISTKRFENKCKAWTAAFKYPCSPISPVHIKQLVSHWKSRRMTRRIPIGRASPRRRCVTSFLRGTSSKPTCSWCRRSSGTIRGGYTALCLCVMSCYSSEKKLHILLNRGQFKCRCIDCALDVDLWVM